MSADTASSSSDARQRSTAIPTSTIQTSSAPPPVQVARTGVVAPPVELQRAAPAPPPKTDAATLAAIAAKPSADTATSTAAWWVRWQQFWLAPRRRPAASFVVSTVVHAALLVLLGLLVTTLELGSGRANAVLATFGAPDAALDQARGAPQLADDAEPAPLEIATTIEIVATAHVDRNAQPMVASATKSLRNVSGSQLVARVGSSDTMPTGGGLTGRSDEERIKLALAAGGSHASEAAVERGLRWLQTHQRLDGSWRFDHTNGPCGGACRHPGTNPSTTGSTALALLPFLGAGYTHRTGPYQKTVGDALYYLKGRLRQTNNGADFQEGTMYAQGIATIALCEAAAMTDDIALKEAAEAALQYIVYAQDKQGGGWRYSPGQAGDMTVTGWQLMALKCGQMGYLKVPADTIHRAVRFLDSMGTDQGAAYGYTSPGHEPTTTAVGLLGRMYTGWRREHPPLVRGIQSLSRRGPSPDDMYYNYYATQVLHHWGGDEWIAWNHRLREFLINTQGREGHETGSWYFEDKHGSGKQGGRLYNTCMAVMTLEVYYRYLPLYGQDAVNDSF